MRLKLACSDFTYPILSHEEALQVISALGLKGVDIGLFEDRSHLQPSREFKDVRRSARRLKKRLDDNGLLAADFFLQLALDYESRALNHPSPHRRRTAREAFLKTLDYAAECNGRHITTLPGVHFKRESRRDSVARSAEELSWRLEKAREYRIVFAIEPHIGSFADSPKRAADLVERTPGLTLTLDYGHLYPRGYSEKEIEPLLEHTSHYHARAINNKTRSSSLADNTLNWKRLFKVMDKAGYRGWIELEYGGNSITGTVELRDYLRKIAI